MQDGGVAKWNMNSVSETFAVVLASDRWAGLEEEEEEKEKIVFQRSVCELVP